MKLKVLTTSDSTDHPGWLKLKASVEKFGYDYTHIQHSFSFGHQLPVIRDWCSGYSGDCTHILYTDCFDTIAFGGPEIVINKFETFFNGVKMLISGEKNCYPHPERAKDYPETQTPWKYVNGGGWLVEIEYFKQLCQKENLTWDSHDQVWLMDSFLRNQGEIKIDYFCRIFQTIAFSYPEEWKWQQSMGKFQNIETGSHPIFFHGNGHTDMRWLYDAAQ